MSRNTSGRCYYAAYHLLTDIVTGEDWRLCHGIITGSGKANKGKPCGHAWLERGRIVMDASGIIVGMARYYTIGDVREVRRFTHEEAIKQATRTGNYGPWNPAIIEAEKWIK